MAIDRTIFLERYPMFSELPESVVNSELALSSLSFPETKVPEEEIRDNMIGLKTAHIFLLEYHDQLNLYASLRLIEEAENLQISKKEITSSNYYSLSIYGKRLTALCSQYFGLAMFVN